MQTSLLLIEYPNSEIKIALKFRLLSLKNKLVSLKLDFKINYN